MEIIMNEFNKDYENFQKAKNRVKEIKDFYIHLIWFVFGMGFMIYINLKYSPEYLWFFWSLLGWGIGLFFHAARVFNVLPFFNKDWEERKIKELMEEDKKRKQKHQ